jgi:hypothetical protein
MSGANYGIVFGDFDKIKVGKTDYSSEIANLPLIDPVVVSNSGTYRNGAVTLMRVA